MIRVNRVVVSLVALLSLIEFDRPVYAYDPPGKNSPTVPVNTQKSLVKIVGAGFSDSTWELPQGQLPTEFSGLKWISGPESAKPAPKANWRKPVVYQHESSAAEIHFNCYRRKKGPSAVPAPGVASTPFAALMEPDYHYQSHKLAAFPQHTAAIAQVADREVLAICDGDLLIKIEVFGGNRESRGKLIRTAADTICAFRRK